MMRTQKLRCDLQHIRGGIIVPGQPKRHLSRDGASVLSRVALAQDSVGDCYANRGAPPRN